MRRGHLTLAGLGLLCVSACYTPRQVTSLSLAEIYPAPPVTEAVVDEMGELTAEESVRRSLTHHPRMRAARLNVEVAEAAVEGGVRLENPELRLSQWHLEDASEGRWGKLDLSLRFRPERPGMNASRRDRGEQGVHQAAARARVTGHQLTRRVRRLHARCVLSAERTKIAEEEAALRDKSVRLMEANVSIGAGTEVDLALERAALAKVRDEAAGHRAEMEEATEHLYALTGVRGARWTIGGSPGGVLEGDISSAIPEVGALEEEALDLRPELREASARLARAHVDLWQQGAKRWPWFRFAQVGYELDDDSTPSSWVLSAGLELPVFHWNTGRIAQARAQVQHAEVVRQREGQEILEEIRGLRTRLARARDRLQQIRDELLPAVQAAADAADKAEARGALKTSKALSVARSRLEARSRYVDAQWEFTSAFIDLYTAVGRPWPSTTE